MCADNHHVGLHENMCGDWKRVSSEYGVYSWITSYLYITRYASKSVSGEISICLGC